VARDVLFYRACKRCQRAFFYCRGRQPGRLYCGEECSTGAREDRERRAHKKYRESPEGIEQHRDEEAERRERRQLERVGDRRCESEQGQLQTVATTAPYARGVEEKCDAPRREQDERVEWLVVAWPGLLIRAAELLGRQVACPCCGRRGPVVRVVELDDWRAEDGS
jgi:hypothetical protein